MGKERNKTSFRRDGVKQEGLAVRELPRRTGAMRGIVIYVYSENDRPPKAPPVPPLLAPDPDWLDPDQGEAQATVNTNQPPGRYCSVLAYSGEYINGSFMFFEWCIIGGAGGVHDGEVYVPKPSYQDLTGAQDLVSWLTGEINKPSGLMGLSGDHVLLDFVDDSPGFPAVVGKIAHPYEDRGTPPQTGQAGVSPTAPTRPRHSLKIKAGEGSFRRWKHNGTVLEIDKNGRFTMDTSFAHNGVLDAQGKEPGSQFEISSGVATLPFPTGTGNSQFVMRSGQDLSLEWKSDPARPSNDPALLRTVTRFNDGGLLMDFPAGTGGQVLIQGTDLNPQLLLLKSTTAASDISGLVTYQGLLGLLNSWKASLENWANTVVVPHQHTSAAPGSPTTVGTPLSSLSLGPPSSSQFLETDLIQVDLTTP